MNPEEKIEDALTICRFLRSSYAYAYATSQEKEFGESIAKGIEDALAGKGLPQVVRNWNDLNLIRSWLSAYVNSADGKKELERIQAFGISREGALAQILAGEYQVTLYEDISAILAESI